MKEDSIKTGVSDDLAKEIEDAINANGVDDSTDGDKKDDAEVDGEKQDDDAKVVDDDDDTDLPDAEALAAEEAAKAEAAAKAAEGKKDEPDQPVITDSHIERAVKAGMTIADAKAFTNADVFDRVVSMLETRSGGDDTSASKQEEESEDLFAQFPELDPDEYDEKIISGFDAMKAAITQLVGENKALNEKVASSGASDYVSGKINSAGESAVAKADDIKKKFTILEAGYKATGEDVSRDDVFAEAMAMVVGNPEAVAAEKQQAAQKREALLTNRPTNVSRKKAVDPEQETIDEIDRKFFGKK